jgi:predicted acylesterase/phospholipase RssA
MNDLDDIFKEYPNKWIPNVLVLGPGGAKGYQMIGALIKLYPYLTNIDSIIGCSVGSIIGMMLCLGYDPKEIAKEANKFNIFDNFHFTSIQDILSKKGLIDPSKIKDKLKELVGKKVVGNVTLKQLYDICGVEFISVISYKDEARAEYVSYKNFPNELVTDVVFASMNIPFIFHKTTFNNHICLDGAMTDPLPLHLKDHGDNKILSITIDSQNNNEDINDDIGMIKHIYEVLILPIVTLKKMSIKNASLKCKILDMNCKFTDMSGATVRKEDKIQMLKEGYGDAEEFLKKLIEDEEDNKAQSICNFEVISKDDIKNMNEVEVEAKTEPVIVKEEPKILIVNKPPTFKKKPKPKEKEKKNNEFLYIEKTAQNKEAFNDVISKNK